MSGTKAQEEVSDSKEELASEVPEKSIPVRLIKLWAVGAQGKVFRARRTDIDKDVDIAVKCIQLDRDETSRLSQRNLLKSEFSIIKGLHHQNLISHIHDQEIAASQVYELPVYQILMEFCEGKTLHEFIKTFVVTPPVLQKWTRQIVDGLTYLHDNRCVHRDIKGDNILLTSNDPDTCTLKIADLGNVRRLLKEATQTKEISHEKGTWVFMSPEIISGEEFKVPDEKPLTIGLSEETNKEHEQKRKTRIGRRTDIWSLGCVVIEMLNGALPEFHDNGKKIDTELAVMCYVGTGGGPTIPTGLPDDVRSFIEDCLQRDPSQRPRGGELKIHPMLTATDVSSWTLPRQTTTPNVSAR